MLSAFLSDIYNHPVVISIITVLSVVWSYIYYKIYSSGRFNSQMSNEITQKFGLTYLDYSVSSSCYLIKAFTSSFIHLDFLHLLASIIILWLFRDAESPVPSKWLNNYQDIIISWRVEYLIVSIILTVAIPLLGMVYLHASLSLYCLYLEFLYDSDGNESTIRTIRLNIKELASTSMFGYTSISLTWVSLLCLLQVSGVYETIVNATALAMWIPVMLLFLTPLIIGFGIAESFTRIMWVVNAAGHTVGVCIGVSIVSTNLRWYSTYWLYSTLIVVVIACCCNFGVYWCYGRTSVYDRFDADDDIEAGSSRSSLFSEYMSVPGEDEGFLNSPNGGVGGSARGHRRIIFTDVCSNRFWMSEAPVYLILPAVSLGH